MLRCPTIEHHASRGPSTTPASTVTVCPGPTRPELVPEARTRSCTLVGSSFVSSITSWSPSGTSTTEGSKRIPSRALTCTVVVPPVAGAPEPPPRRSNPAAAGFTAMPAATPRATTSTPASASRAGRGGAAGATASGMGTGSPARRAMAARRPASEVRAAETMSGTNAKSAAAPRTETTARTQEGTAPGGSAKSSTHRLTTTTRNVPARLMARWAARTVAGPPPMVTGRR